MNTEADTCRKFVVPGLNTDPGARRPQDQQIVLLNREAVIGGGHLALGAHS